MENNIENFIMSKILYAFKCNLIQEIQFSELWHNLFLLSERDEFKDILYDDFLLNGDSFKFSNEFNKCVEEGYLFDEHNDLFYISMNSKQANDIGNNINLEERKKYLKLTSEYIKLNMEKRKVL